MREKTKKEIKEIVREILREEKLVESEGGFWGWRIFSDDYVEGVVNKQSRMETDINKLSDLTKLDSYEYVEEKKLKKKPKKIELPEEEE